MQHEQRLTEKKRKDLLKHNFGIQVDQEFEKEKKILIRRKSSIYCLYEFSFLKSLQNRSAYFWNLCFQNLRKSDFCATWA